MIRLKKDLILKICFLISFILNFVFILHPQVMINYHIGEKMSNLFDNDVSNILRIKTDFQYQFIDTLYRLQSQLSAFNIDSSINKEFSTLISYLENRYTYLNYPNKNVKIKPPMLVKGICPYVYKGPEEGFVQEQCETEIPLNKLITVVVYLDDKNLDVVSLLKKFDEFNLPTIIGVHSLGFYNEKINGKNTKLMSFSHGSTGQLWNDIVNAVNTPFILIGQNIKGISSLESLKRQIQILSEDEKIVAIGGALRSTEGLWETDCYQSKLSNYILRYKNGYFHSKNECMICDHLTGPFLAKTIYLKQHPFDIQQQGNIVLNDWLLQRKSENHVIMSCPDTMYLTTSINENHKQSWLPFSIKWKLTRIYLPSGNSLFFSCEDSHLWCKTSEIIKGYTLPPCCIDQITKAVKFLIEFLELNNIQYILVKGALLGAVKMQQNLPWAKDVDIWYEAEKHDNLMKAEKQFIQNGYRFKEITATYCCTKQKHFVEGEMHILFDDMYIDLYSKNNISSYMGDIIVPTKVKFENLNLKTVYNPGIYVRNRYGYHVLKHFQRDITISNDTTLSFKSCPIPNQHACLDRIPTDGNLQFLN